MSAAPFPVGALVLVTDGPSWLGHVERYDESDPDWLYVRNNAGWAPRVHVTWCQSV